MAVYTCEKCGMSVGKITCGACDAELVHSELKLDDGRTVFISECPDGHGKIKSPMCCGDDMTWHGLVGLKEFREGRPVGGLFLCHEFVLASCRVHATL